jgi:serine/threonine protein kinase
VRRPTIAGYDDVRELDQGGQAVVFQAMQQSTRRPVAIKVLREGPVVSETARRRFAREIQLAAQLRHANIVTVFDSGETAEGQPFCVMEYVEGRRLDEYVRDENLSLEATLLLLLPVLHAVGHAHERGIVHRDLKPSNVLVDAEGQPKVMDFGLARTLSTPAETGVSVTGQLLGTIAYMSPEQVSGSPDEIDARTDVYSLGVVLYELLTGRYPYPVEGRLLESMHSITAVEPTPPTKAWSNAKGVPARAKRGRSASLRCPIDREIETILLTALAKDRDRRYATVASFADDLERYLAGRPIQARKDSRAYRLAKQVRRHRGGVASVAVSLAAVAAVVVVLLVRQPASRPMDEAELARFQTEEAKLLVVRQELLDALASHAKTAPGASEPIAQDSLKIIEDAIGELKAALRRNPDNPELHQLLLATREKEIDLLRKMNAVYARR